MAQQIINPYAADATLSALRILLPQAIADAKKCGTTIAIVVDSISTAEDETFPLGYCPMAAINILHRHRSAIVALVEPNGGVLPRHNPFMDGTPEHFFYEHAGYSFDPKRETALEGRMQRAIELATAEREGKTRGLRYVWDVDPESDSSDFSDERPAWCSYRCAVIQADDEDNFLATLCGIDFGREHSAGDEPPRDHPYRRVVNAELASQAIAELEGGAR